MVGIWVSTPRSIIQIHQASLLLRALLSYSELSSTWPVCNLFPYLKGLAETALGVSRQHHVGHSFRIRIQGM